MRRLHHLDPNKLRTDPVEELSYAAEALLQEEFDADLRDERVRGQDRKTYSDTQDRENYHEEE